jgi:hypothetical protein
MQGILTSDLCLAISGSPSPCIPQRGRGKLAGAPPSISGGSNGNFHLPERGGARFRENNYPLYCGGDEEHNQI